MPACIGGGDEGVAQLVRLGRVGHAERTADAVERALAARLMLGAPEIRQHVVEAPAGVAELAPMVEILRLAADIEQAVDRGRAAEHLAARLEDHAAVQLRLRFRLVEPIDPRVLEQAPVAERDVDPEMPVARPGFEQNDPISPAGGQAVREHAAGRARADDHEIGLEDWGSGAHAPGSGFAVSSGRHRRKAALMRPRVRRGDGTEPASAAKAASGARAPEAAPAP